MCGRSLLWPVFPFQAKPRPADSWEFLHSFDWVSVLVIWKISLHAENTCFSVSFSMQSPALLTQTGDWGETNVANPIATILFPLLLPRGGGPRKELSAFPLYRACPPTWRKVFRSCHVSRHWTQELNLLFYLNMFVILCCIFWGTLLFWYYKL